MKCKNPYFKDPTGKVYGPGQGRLQCLPFGCGQCMACRINKVREWQHRIMLERMAHKQSAFVTLTFDDENLPEKVTVRELQLFLKKWRYRYGEIRYFGVGEYGDKSGRPHYHLALFGGHVNESFICPDCNKFKCPNIEKKKRLRCELQGKVLCIQEEVMECWDKGIVQVSNVGAESAGYIAGYAAKGMTKKDSKNREFAIQSRKPGLGHDAVVEVGKTMRLVPETQLVRAFQYGKNARPLGRYLTRILMETRGQCESVLTRSVNEYQDDLADEIGAFEFPYEVYRDRARPACDAAERKHFRSRRRL